MENKEKKCCGKCWNMGAFAVSSPPTEVNDQRLCAKTSCDCHEKKGWEWRVDKIWKELGYLEGRDVSIKLLIFKLLKERDEMWRKKIEKTGIGIVAPDKSEDWHDGWKHGSEQMKKRLSDLLNEQ